LNSFWYCFVGEQNDYYTLLIVLLFFEFRIIHGFKCIITSVLYEDLDKVGRHNDILVWNKIYGFTFYRTLLVLFLWATVWYFIHFIKIPIVLTKINQKIP
jgi:hypothetical protein